MKYFMQNLKTSLRKNMVRLFLLFCFCLLINENYAAIYTITNTNDSGTGSLRDAITSSNTHPGADTLIFNLSSSDPGYNLLTNTWTIILGSPLPYLTAGSLFIDGTTQPGYTTIPLIALTTNAPSSVLWSFGIFSSYNKISGLRIYGFANGILISEPSGINNIITGCFIGTNADGTGPAPNSNGIVINNNAHNNTIENNLISGNLSTGIVIKNSNTTLIHGNKIGCDKSGLFAIGNENGIIADSSSNNIIGGLSLSGRNILSGNTGSSIIISGRTSSNNLIQNNIIGTNISGTEKLSNLYGITITRASNNTIGPNNLISGNTDIGILLTGKYTRNNVVTGNIIGTDITGTQLLDNHKGIVIKSLANSNTIGGSSSAGRNIISGNLEIGIYIEAADSNRIIGNFIGTDITGMNKVAVPYQSPYYAHLDSLVQGNGIEFNATAKYNVLGGQSYGERNIVSGHKVYGVVYYGNCSFNHLYNNFIGTDVTSKNPLPNATGICFDCASNHNDVINCVISGNLSYGLFYVTRGTEYNRFFGNRVGVDSSGTMAVPNDIGIVVSTGTAYNIIGGDADSLRNIFSGNRLSGMMVTNQLTEFNQIRGNFFGTDITGTQAIPNKYGIIVTTFTKHNTFDRNLISGNEMSGVIIYEHADSNLFINNKIGIGINNGALGNGSGGIFLDQGATGNVIGALLNPNIIAYNSDGGILVKHEGTLGNKISANSFFDNNGLAIDIFPFGTVNTNDPADWDEGPSSMLNHPVITQAKYNSSSGTTWVTGTVDCHNVAGAVIEMYLAAPDATGYGEGLQFIGNAYPDQNGAWSMATDSVNLGSILTALTIDNTGNTSEFSENFNNVILSTGKDDSPFYFQLYPNPCTEFINITCHSELSDIKAYYIIDKNGKTIGFNDTPQKVPIRIDLKRFNVQSGSYILNILCVDGMSFSTSFIVQ